MTTVAEPSVPASQGALLKYHMPSPDRKPGRKESARPKMRSHRKEKVASVIRDIVSDTIAHRLQDPRIVALTTVTRVVVTGDLLVSKVYLSVHGGEAAERKTIAAIRHASGFIQRIVARELSIRQCPELRFEIDEAAKGTRKTLQLLEENRQRHPEWFQNDNGEDANLPGIPGSEGNGNEVGPGMPGGTDE